MPINTVLSHIKSVLSGLPLPQDLGVMSAFITPLDPNTDALEPCAYVWPAHGDERRHTKPRADPGNLASGGDKQTVHQIDVWLVWFGEAAEPNIDVAFPAVVDGVMACLRNTPLLTVPTILATDPVTGARSALLAIGENMSYEVGGVRSVLDERYLRYDALVTCEVIEEIQA